MFNRDPIGKVVALMARRLVMLPQRSVLRTASHGKTVFFVNQLTVKAAINLHLSESWNTA